MHRPVAFLLLLACGVGGCGSPAPRPACRDAVPLGTICGFENPEDVAWVPPYALVVVSNLRFRGQGGFLSAFTPGQPPARLWPVGAGLRSKMRGIGDEQCAPPDGNLFAPHGLFVDLHDPVAPLLYVINHGGREAVEIFGFGRRNEETVLVWLGCVPLPPGTSGNDVAVAADGEVIVSNYMPAMQSLWGNLKLLFGWHTGDVLAWRRDHGWRHVPGTAASGPNGVEVSPDGRWVYVAATGGGSLTRVPRDGNGAVKQVTVPGLPDNLSWTARGTLLLATHESVTAFLRCTRSAPCRSPWRLLEIDPDTLQVSERFRDGDLVGAVASAQEVGDRIYLGAVFGDRIGVLHSGAQRE